MSKRKKNLTEGEREDIVSHALSKAVWVELEGESEPEPVLSKEAKNEIATMFGCRHWAVEQIWKRAKSNKQKTGHYVAPSLKRQRGEATDVSTPGDFEMKKRDEIDDEIDDENPSLDTKESYREKRDFYCTSRRFVIPPRMRSELIPADNDEPMVAYMQEGDEDSVGIMGRSLGFDALPKKTAFLFFLSESFEIANKSKNKAAEVWLGRLDFRPVKYDEEFVIIKAANGDGWYRSTEEERVLLICVTPRTNKLMLLEDSIRGHSWSMMPGKIYTLPIGKKFKVSNDEEDSPLKLVIIRAKTEK